MQNSLLVQNVEDSFYCAKSWPGSPVYQIIHWHKRNEGSAAYNKNDSLSKKN